MIEEGCDRQQPGRIGERSDDGGREGRQGRVVQREFVRVVWKDKMARPSMPPTPQAASAAPVAERDRIVVLDGLRGLAICGIAVVNIQFFAFPFADLGRWEWGRVSLPEAAARLAVMFFANYEFFSIFAMLFGMGLALQSRRAQQFNQPFVGLYLRRLAVLLVLGLAHALLLWYGDILALYALMAFIALWCRNLSPRTLLIAAAVLFLVPVVLEVFFMLQNPQADRRAGIWDQLRAPFAAQVQQRADARRGHPSTASAASQASSPPGGGSIRAQAISDSNQAAVPMLKLIDFLADEVRIYRSGTMREKILHRSVFFFIGSPVEAVTMMGWRALAMMLLGIYIVKRGWFDGSDRYGNVYRRFLVIGLVLGVPLHSMGMIVQMMGPDNAWQLGVKTISDYLGSFPMCLAYMGGLAWLCQQGVWRRRLKPLAAVGRMALTNYLGQSFLFGLVFYGYGLGWFGQVSFVSAELIVLAVLLLQILISSLWLRYFQYGPLEWLWRVATYLRLVPLRARPGANPSHSNASAR